MKPLTTHQKKELMLHHIMPAWSYLCSQLRRDGQDLPPFDEWRHDEIERATGKRGLLCCNNDDFCLVAAHMANLRGEMQQAMHWQLRAGTEPRRHWEAKIVAILNSVGLRNTYAEAIAIRRWKRPVSDLTAHELSQLYFTLTARAKTHRKRPEQSEEVPA